MLFSLFHSSEWCGGEWPISPCREHESCHAKYDRSKFVDGLKVKDFVYFESSEENVKNALVEVRLPLLALGIYYLGTKRVRLAPNSMN